jgi:hypothetical protein
VGKLNFYSCSGVVAEGGVIRFTARGLVVLILALELSVLAIKIALLIVSEALIEQEKSTKFSPEAPQAPIEDEAAEIAPLVEGSEVLSPLPKAAIT